MSARPQPGPVRVDDLDLLISRSLDGDLAPEEERQLERVLDTDPSARSRRAAMASLVERLEALPEPETPFALATRVAAQVDEGTRGLSASFHRFGLFPGKGAIGVGVGALVVLAIGATLMNPPAADSPKRTEVAEQVDDGRVQVFFPEKQKDQASSRSAAPAAEAPRQVVTSPAGADRPAAALAENETKAASGPTLAQALPAAAPSRAADEVASTDRYAPERDNAAGARLEPAPSVGPAEEATVLTDAREKGRVAAAAPAPAAPAPPAVLAAKAESRVGEARGAVAAPELSVAPASRWRLAAPARLDGLPRPIAASYRLTLDAEGRVTSLSRLTPGVSPAGLEERLLALRFVSEGASGPGTVDVSLTLPER